MYIRAFASPYKVKDILLYHPVESFGTCEVLPHYTSRHPKDTVVDAHSHQQPTRLLLMSCTSKVVGLLIIE
jgi:hypothetical protein